MDYAQLVTDDVICTAEGSFFSAYAVNVPDDPAESAERLNAFLASLTRPESDNG